MMTSDPRPRLTPPDTWERALSAGGVARIPRAVTWQRLIVSSQLPLLALLRNLRSVIQAGIRPESLQCIVGRLWDPEAVRRSQVPPSQWLRAMKALLGPAPERAHRMPWKLRRRRQR
ncbi:telomerase component p80-like [Lagopus leucura]|uniref:telomerase component p80-like n=1 Tax=Lagopus leucura TaxID=30410 RepID=UPI001C665129|nr:telomerase component p80-like [Lagopus leucura]